MIRALLLYPSSSIAKVILALGLLLYTNAFAATKYWIGAPMAGKWSLNSNWNPSGPPGANDTALFSNSYPCTLDVNASIKLLRFNSYSGVFDFENDTLRIADSADFSFNNGSILPKTGAIEFIGSGSSSLIPRTGQIIPTIIQSGTGTTTVKNFGCKAKGLVVKHGVFDCGNAFEDTITGIVRVETEGTLMLGSVGLCVNEMQVYAGSIDFGTSSLTIVDSTSNYLQFDNVIAGTGKLVLRQSGHWHYLYPPLTATLPPIYKYSGDSLELHGALKSLGLYLFEGSWHWGAAGGRVHVMGDIQTSGGGGAAKMLFADSPGDTVKTTGNVNLSGLVTADGIKAGAGVIVFEGATYQQLSPLVNQLLPEIRHTGTGTLMVQGDLFCSSFFQSSGKLNTNGKNITTSGSFTIINGTSWTIQGLGSGIDSITAASATLKGSPGDTFDLIRTNAWKMHVNGTLFAEYIKLGFCTASCSTGFANNSISTGNNPNWKFGKFWRGSATDSQWMTSSNWAPPAPPQSSDSTVFDNSAYTGCIMNGFAAVRVITFTSEFTKQFDFGSNSLTIFGPADFRSAGIIVPGSGSIKLASSGSVQFFYRPFNPLPKIQKIGSGTVFMSDTSRLMTPEVSVSNGSLQLFNPVNIDSLNVTNPGTLMFDNAIVRSDTVRAISGSGTLNLGWASLFVTGNADLSLYASVSVMDKSKIIFIGNDPHAFSPPASTTFPYIGAMGSMVTTVGFRGLSVDTLDIISGTFNFGASVVDSVKTKLKGSGNLDFSLCTLVVKADSVNFNEFAAIFVDVGVIKFAGDSTQKITPKAGAWLPNIICNNDSGLVVANAPLKALSLGLQMGAVSFIDALSFQDSIGALSAIGAAKKGLNFGNDTLNVKGPVDLTGVTIASQSTGTLLFSGDTSQNFIPSALSTHPNIVHCGNGRLIQAGALTCYSFAQTAGTYNLNGFSNTITSGDFSVAHGQSSSLTGLGGASIVVQAGNATFAGQAGNMLNLYPTSLWRLNVSGSKSANDAIIGNSDASGGPAAAPMHCTMEPGNVNWNSTLVAPQLFDTLGTIGTINASQRRLQNDTVDIYYQLIDRDEAFDTITLRYRNGPSGLWQPLTSGAGDIGVVSALDSSVHRHIRWPIAGRFGASFSSDSIQLALFAIDGYDNKTMLTSGSAILSITDSSSFNRILVNNLVVQAVNVGDSAISISWMTDTSKHSIKNVLFGFAPDNFPDAAALLPFPYRDTVFVIVHTVQPGTWRLATRLLDSANRISAIRPDSVLIRNMPPVVTAPGDTIIDQGTPWIGRLSWHDVNGDSIRFRLEKAPSGLILDSVQGIMHWTPGPTDTGVAVCIVNAHDPRGGNAWDTFTVAVRIVIGSPRIVYMGDSVAREDTMFYARIKLSVPNAGDSAWFFTIRIPAWMRLAADTLTGIPAENDIGIDTLLFAARSKAGIESALTKKIIVVRTNHIPAIMSWRGPDTVRQYGHTQWALSVIDKDIGDSLRFTWLIKPEWMSVVQAPSQGSEWSGIVTAAPLLADKGWVQFAFLIQDAAQSSVSIRDSVFILSLPRTVIEKRQVAFGALSYIVSGGSGNQPAASFEATLRSLDDTSLTIAGKNQDGKFEFYPLSDGRYEFMARAIDSHGLRDTVPPKDVVVVSGASRHVFYDTSWTMVSIPCIPYATASLASGGHVLHWDETAGEESIYRYYRGESAMNHTTPGLSYWRKSSDSLGIVLASGTVRDSAVSVDLSKGAYGWNQVASPYPYPVKWPSDATVWKWNSATNDYEDGGGVLEPWQGYWVMADSSAVVRLGSAPAFSSGATAKRGFAYFTNTTDWRIRVSLRSGDGNDADNSFGFSPGARDEYDANDRPEPPRLSESGYAFFWHPEWKRSVQEFASDVRRRVKRTNAFQIGIAPSQSQSSAVRVRFYGVETLSSLYCFLADADTVFLIEANKEYELAPSASTVFKTVFVTADRDYLKKYPLRFAFARPFPNPCRPMAIISYTLPYRFAKNGLLNDRPYTVRMALFDIMGRRVRQLVDHEQEPGSYRVVWDGKSVSGKIASPGAYFCRLEANEYSSIVKVTMMR